ncbi:MAG: SufD family Fe-S cluster assembly protein [Sphingomonadales bacterium]|nr:SufD family Fe-S cluster assembly protein [Sphingomonadales bacterium]
MTARALPDTRAVEDWRYAPQAALAELWPLEAPDTVTVPAGEHFVRAIVLDTDAVVHLDLTLAAGATAAVHVVNVGSGYGRVEVTATLGAGADFTLGAVQLAGGSAMREIVASVTHAAPDATSRQIVRTVLGGQATGTVLGRIRVERGAIGTDAEQSIRAMLLDRTATANARPELEIFADDVKCAHGCAVGELDAMGLFYLQSRGLEPPRAKALMLQAFLAEALVGAEDEERLCALALAALEGLL